MQEKEKIEKIKEIVSILKKYIFYRRRYYFKNENCSKEKRREENSVYFR